MGGCPERVGEERWSKREVCTREHGCCSAAPPYSPAGEGVCARVRGQQQGHALARRISLLAGWHTVPVEQWNRARLAPGHRRVRWEYPSTRTRGQDLFPLVWTADGWGWGSRRLDASGRVASLPFTHTNLAGPHLVDKVKVVAADAHRICEEVALVVPDGRRRRDTRRGAACEAERGHTPWWSGVRECGESIG